MAPRPQRKTKSVDALKHCEHDPYVLLAVSRLVSDKIQNVIIMKITIFSNQRSIVLLKNHRQFASGFGTSIEFLLMVALKSVQSAWYAHMETNVRYSRFIYYVTLQKRLILRYQFSGSQLISPKTSFASKQFVFLPLVDYGFYVILVNVNRCNFCSINQHQNIANGYFVVT